jgi:hypothetical protein
MKHSRSGLPTNYTGLEQMLMVTAGDQNKLPDGKFGGGACHRQEIFYY